MLIENLLQRISVQHGSVTAKIHCDAGTEFTNSAVRGILDKRGVQIEIAAAKAPEQNGITERNARTVGEKIRSLSLQSGLETRYWPLILQHVILLLNYTPNKVSGTSAWEAVYRTLPPLTDLHPFGCRALWLDPSEQKLEARASEAIYVGHASGGHQLFNPVSKRVITH